jgi:hypothetical protein
MFIYLFVIAAALFLLAVLVLRFVQPEIIYIIREQLIRVGINKVIIEQEADRGKNHNERYNELTLKEFRYETLGHSTEYALERAGKIRELYSAMDAKRAKNIPELEAERKPQICIVELANLLRNMGEHLKPETEYDYKTVKADAILGFITLQISTEQGGVDESEAAAAPMPPPSDIVHWFQTHPISIEQAVEILLAAVYGLAYRLREQDPAPSQVAGNVLAEARRNTQSSPLPSAGGHAAI